MELLCYKQVQSFRVHCLFTGQFNTEEYSQLEVQQVFIYGAKHGLCSIFLIGANLSDQTNTITGYN